MEMGMKLKSNNNSKIKSKWRNYKGINTYKCCQTWLILAAANQNMEIDRKFRSQRRKHSQEESPSDGK